MNDLSGTAVGRRFRAPVPAAVPCVIVPLLLAGLAVSLLILVVVHNALLLAAVLFLSAAAASFLLWNAASFRNHGALLVFLDRLPASDLVTARDGQLIKITGVVCDNKGIAPAPAVATKSAAASEWPESCWG